MHCGLTICLILLSYQIYADPVPTGACFYNDYQGFCVTADANFENAECHALDGWLQFYAADPHQPWPRTYRGCGDDGIVFSHPGLLI